MPRKGQKAKAVNAVAANVVEVRGEGLARKEAGSSDSVESDSRERSRASRGAKDSSDITVIEDNSDGEGAVVSISRTALSKLQRRSSVQRFGTVDSDESGSSAVDVAYTEPSGSSASDKKRRMISDPNETPSKIRVQDLTLSPRKRSAPVEARDLESPERDGRRSSSRLRKPSQKGALAGPVNATLLERIDGLVNGREDEAPGSETLSESSYKPAASRSSVLPGRRPGGKAGKGKRVSKGGKEGVLVGSTASGDIDNGDVSMKDVSVPNKAKKNRSKSALALSELSSLSDSDWSPPSPTSIFQGIAARAAAKTAAKKSDNVTPDGVSRPPNVDKRPPRDSPDWDICDDAERPVGHDAQPGSQPDASLPGVPSSSGSFDSVQVAPVGLPGSRRRGDRGVRSSQPVDGSVRGDAGVERSVAPVKGTGVVGAGGSVFVSAVPDSDDDDDDLDAEDVALQQAQGSGVIPLLDSELVHPDLAELYGSLPWINQLRRCKFMGYVNTEDAFDAFTPASYGGLLESVPP
ncbi:hypothetical protein VNI00_013394 [Paramarasmius palmivorus]|uniref:Uncharacterized protein n=1 Tax=Paramarasmius palmivorus TaxID=297713 RepID=A0AAW0BZG1_9AGAR